MHYYNKHIGDFNNKTRHLTRLERSIYLDLIELYYITERPLDPDVNKLARLIIASSQEEKDALQAVLQEFFQLRNDGYFNKRCEEEIQAYKNRKTSAKEAAKKRWSKINDLQHATALRPHCEGNPKAMLTNNQEPIIKKENKTKEKNGGQAALFDDDFKGKFGEFWNTYPLKVKKPLAMKNYKAALGKATHAEIMGGVVRYIANKPEGIAFAHPSSWLNAERWGDEFGSGTFKAESYTVSNAKRLIEYGLDPNLYRKEQIDELAWGIKDGLDVMKYSSPENSGAEMRSMRIRLKNQMRTREDSNKYA